MLSQIEVGGGRDVHVKPRFLNAIVGIQIPSGSQFGAFLQIHHK